MITDINVPVSYTHLDVYKRQPLIREEREQFLAFGEHLGYLDREMQERTLSLYLEELEREAEELNQEIAQKSRLYTSAGILAGLFLTVVFI